MSPFRTTHRHGSVKELLNPLRQSTLQAQVSATSSQNSSIFHKTALLWRQKESASSASPTWGHVNGVKPWQPGKLGKEHQAEEILVTTVKGTDSLKKSLLSTLIKLDVVLSTETWIYNNNKKTYFKISLFLVRDQDVIILYCWRHLRIRASSLKWQTALCCEDHASPSTGRAISSLLWAGEGKLQGLFKCLNESSGEATAFHTTEQSFLKLEPPQSNGFFA